MTAQPPRHPLPRQHVPRPHVLESHRPTCARPCSGGDERGAGTVITGCILLFLCLVMVVGVWIAGWVDGVHRARQGADLAALAAAQAHVQGRPECPAARRVAEQNGVQLVGCSVTGNRRDFVVRVTVRGELLPRVGGRSHWAQEEAVAGSLRRP